VIGEILEEFGCGRSFFVGLFKKKKIFSKFLFIAYDVWEQSEKVGGD
jgi:hypothetical protein